MKFKTIQQQVEEWNRLHPVGTMVVVTIHGDGTTDEARTQSRAWVENGKVMICLEGREAPCRMTRRALMGDLEEVATKRHPLGEVFIAYPDDSRAGYARFVDALLDHGAEILRSWRGVAPQFLVRAPDREAFAATAGTDRRPIVTEHAPVARPPGRREP